MDLVKKSIDVLKGLQLRNGGILATPKNGAYPYIYPRDAVIVTKAFNRVGLCDNSKKFYRFLKKIARMEQFEEVFQRYHRSGLPCVTRKHEHDNDALVIHGIYDTYLYSKDNAFLEEMLPFIKECVASIKKSSDRGLIWTERSIHELYRLENGYEIWVNSATCRALYDAYEIAKILKLDEGKKWYKRAQKLKANIKDKFFDKKQGVFIKNLKRPDLTDFTQLSPFYFNIFNSKVLLRKSMSYVKKNLWDDEVNGFRRLKKFEIYRDWHWCSGGTGSWTNFTIWAARFYRHLGDRKMYSKCMDFVYETASRTKGLLPEHVSTRNEFEQWKLNEIEFNPRVINGLKIAEKMNAVFKKKFKKDLICWATPLGWPHAEYILLKKDK